MQSTRSASMMFLRISPSFDWLDDIDPLASTKPASPVGARWWMKCCTQAKLALPAGGTPYTQRLSSLSSSPRQSLSLKGRVRQHVVGLQVGMPIGVEGVAVGELRVDAADRQ